jgi:hypothetical protein
MRTLFIVRSIPSTGSGPVFRRLFLRHKAQPASPTLQEAKAETATVMISPTTFFFFFFSTNLQEAIAEFGGVLSDPSFWKMVTALSTPHVFYLITWTNADTFYALTKNIGEPFQVQTVSACMGSVTAVKISSLPFLPLPQPPTTHQPPPPLPGRCLQ